MQGKDDPHGDEYIADPIDAAYRNALREKHRAERQQQAAAAAAAADADSAYYNRFRRSIQRGAVDEPELDEASDPDYSSDADYTGRADQSFYVTDSESAEALDEEYLEEDSEEDARENLIDDLLDESEESESAERDNTYTSRHAGARKPQFQWFRLFVVLLAASMVLPAIPATYRIFSNTARTLVPHSPHANNATPSFSTLQKQINHIYNELSARDEKQRREFDEKVKIIISQFEKNIKKLLPRRVLGVDEDVRLLQQQYAELAEKYDTLSQQLAGGYNHDDMLSALRDAEQALPDTLPVTLNNDTNEVQLQGVKNYLSTLIAKTLETVLPGDHAHIQQSIERYVDAALGDKLASLDRATITNEIRRHIEENKVELWHDIRAYMATANGGEATNAPISTSTLRQIVLQVHNSHRHQWESDLDFATSVQGTSIIGRLTSHTFPRGNQAKADVLLRDSAGGSPSAYWECARDSPGGKCGVAFAFNRALHLTRLWYVHGRLENNVHVMASAPRNVSVYVRLQRDRDVEALVVAARQHGQGAQHARDGRFVKIGTYAYDLASAQVRQQFTLPGWYIGCKPLVRAVLFEVESTYGSEEYVSLRKFVVNAVVESDLAIIREGTFPLRLGEQQPVAEYGVAQAPEYSTGTTHSTARPSNVPAFGDDEQVG